MMKKSIILLSFAFIIIVLLIHSCHVQAKRDYFIEIENIEVTTPKNMHFVDIHAFRMIRYNQTATALNMSYAILQTLPLDTLMHGTAYEQLPNKKYSMVPVKFPVWTLCKVINEEPLLYPKMKKEGNLPKKCPVLAGEYWLDNFLVDSDSLPERFPGTRWLGDIRLKSKKLTIFSVKLYVYLNRDVVF